MTNKLPYLSICIPTFERAQLLDVCLATVLPQVQAAGDFVECVVCDNNSSDETSTIINRYAEQYPLRSFRNQTNIGILGNITKVVTQYACGDYVLLLGDDDVLTAGAVERMVRTIQSSDVPDLVALNVGYQPGSLRPTVTDALGGVQETTGKQLRNVFLGSHVPFESLFSGPCADFTASYSFLLRRHLWCGEFPEPYLDRPFQSVRTTYPHSYIIADAMPGKMAHYIETPSVIVYEMPSQEFSWATHRAINSVLHATSLLKMYERNGVPRAKLDPYFLYQLEHRAIDLGDLLWDRSCVGGFREAVRFGWIMKRYPWKLTKAFLVAFLHPQAPMILRMLASSLQWISRISKASATMAKVVL